MKYYIHHADGPEVRDWCDQCDEAPVAVFAVRYSWAATIAGENPDEVHTQDLCHACHGDFSRIVRDGAASLRD